MTRFSTERWAGIAGLGFVVAYVGAFAMGIEVGPSNREILDYYADSGNRAREVVAFFLIAAAALCLLLFVGLLGGAGRLRGGLGRVGVDPRRGRAFPRDGVLGNGCRV